MLLIMSMNQKLRTRNQRHEKSRKLRKNDKIYIALKLPKDLTLLVRLGGC